LLAAPQALQRYGGIVDSEPVDRYVVAAEMFRFWWLVAGLGGAITAWLLWSIARSFS
jgi:hypothetical protein